MESWFLAFQCFLLQSSRRCSLACSLDWGIVFDRTSSQYRIVIRLPIRCLFVYYLDTNAARSMETSHLIKMYYMPIGILDLLQSH